MEIQAGNVDIVVAGGVEHMSSAEPYITGNIKWGKGETVSINLVLDSNGCKKLKYSLRR